MIAALGILIRTSVLLACVSLLSLALRRASASVRHALWVVALLAVLAIAARLRILRNGTGPFCRRRLSSNRIRHNAASATEPEVVSAHAILGGAPLAHR
jgi:hypothetical protein